MSRLTAPLMALLLGLLTALVVGQEQEEANVDGTSLGNAVYGNCSGCHGHEGEGGFGPAFEGNQALEDDDYVLATVLYGTAGMPPFAEQLSNEQIAAVVTHIRTTWGNDFGEITPEDVQQAREDGQAQ